MKAEGTADDSDAYITLSNCVRPRPINLVELTTPEASE